MILQSNRSKQLQKASENLIPGGVNSPVRAFGSVGGDPIYMASAKDAWLTDVDGNQYLDLINSWGPMILGHGREEVVESVKEQADRGFSYGTPTELEFELAQQVKRMLPELDKMRLVSSGTEACMSAIRLARGYTGRNKILKFAGCYHGHADAFLVKAGSGMMSFGIPGSPGIPKSVTEDTLLAEFNDRDAVREIVKAHGEELACIILEPVAGNMGCIPPEDGFLRFLSDLCAKHGILLIFDEVMTGFRLSKGGASSRFGIYPDLYCFGKVIGGGMPVGAFGGKAGIMSHLAPEGPVYQAGTLSGNPLAVTSGLSTLRILEKENGIYDRIEKSTSEIAGMLKRHFESMGKTHVINQCGSMVSIHFGTTELRNYTQAAAAGNQFFNKFFHHMLENGVYLPPSAFETWFISAAIGEKELSHFEGVLGKFRG